MHLVLLRAEAAVQIGFHGSDATSDSSELTIADATAVAQWATQLWEAARAEWIGCDGPTRPRPVVVDVLTHHPPPSGDAPGPTAGGVTVTSAPCIQHCFVAATAMSLVDVGRSLRMETLSRSGGAAHLLLVVMSQYPTYGQMTQSLRRTLHSLATEDVSSTLATSGVPQGTGSIMSALVYRTWRVHTSSVSMTANVPTPPSDANTAQAKRRPADLLCAVDSQYITPVAEPPLACLNAHFPQYSVLRTLQSILLTRDESILVVSSGIETTSCVCVAMTALIAPMPCEHVVCAFADSRLACRLLRGVGASPPSLLTTNSGAPMIIGIASDSIATIVAEAYHPRAVDDSRTWWIADARTGVVARVQTLSPSIGRSLVLLPPMEKVKDVYRKSGAGFSATEFFVALLESMVALIGGYRKALDLNPTSIQVLRLVASGEPSLLPFAQTLAGSASWASFSQQLLQIERVHGDQQQLLISLLRRLPTSNSTAPTVPVVSTTDGAFGTTTTTALPFALRCARRYPELYAQEFAAAGRPLPKDAGAAAGKLFKDLFGKAKGVVTQITSGPYEVEVARSELPYCQCSTLFWANPTVPPSNSKTTPGTAGAVPTSVPTQTATTSLPPPLPSATGSHNAPRLAVPLLPLDIVHHFDCYHATVASWADANTTGEGEGLRRTSIPLPTPRQVTSEMDVRLTTSLPAPMDVPPRSPATTSPSAAMPPAVVQRTEPIAQHHSLPTLAPKAGNGVLDELFGTAPTGGSAPANTTPAVTPRQQAAATVQPPASWDVAAFFES